MNSNEVIKSISCGYCHSLLLTTNGDIYAFGCNRFCQIGNGNNTNQLKPVKITGSRKFNEILCNPLLNISVAKADNDYCYVWGECENETFSTPQKTEIKSIHEIFAKYSKRKITYRKIDFHTTSVCISSNSNPSLKKLLKLFNNPKQSDLKFKIENKYIYVQKCILETNCKYFEFKFTENTRAIRESKESRKFENEIEIKEYSYDVYYAFLKYLYTDCIDIKAEKAMDLLVLANNYKEEDLKLKSAQLVKESISIENVCYLYSVSIKYNLLELENHCFKFAVNKMNKICTTDGFLEMDKISMKKLMEGVAKNEAFKS